MSVLITATELAAALDLSAPPTVLDVRWRLTVAGGPSYDGHADYLAGHIPGAVFVDLENELAAHPADPSEGRHPLPSADDLQQAVRRWGVSPGNAVVAYDGEGNLAAARAWWLLRWAGVEDVRILDGALPAWVAEDRPLATDDVVPVPGSFTITPGSMPTIDTDGAAGWPQHGVLLDARAPERYRGESEPIDPKAGHVPGALNAPTGANLDEEGRFRSAAELRSRFAALGATSETPVAAYCGSGVTAAHEVAALAIAGIDAALYPGSWSQWSNQHRPVATGD